MNAKGNEVKVEVNSKGNGGKAETKTKTSGANEQQNKAKVNTGVKRQRRGRRKGDGVAAKRGGTKQ